MSVVTHSHPERATGFLARVLGALGAFADAYTKAMACRRTYHELSRLSDRELDDLGLDRVDLPEAARKAVYGA